MPLCSLGPWAYIFLPSLGPPYSPAKSLKGPPEGPPYSPTKFLE